MNRTRRFSAASALLAAAMAMPVAGWAQTQEGPSSSPAAQAETAMTTSAIPRPKPPVTRAAQGAGQPAGMEQGVEQHIRDLHKELHITAAQQPQWDQFTAVMRANAQAMSQSLDQRAQQISTMNAVDNMTSYAQLAEQRSQDLVKLATAFQTLYGTFSDQQKKDADALFQRHAEVRAEKHAS